MTSLAEVNKLSEGKRVRVLCVSGKYGLKDGTLGCDNCVTVSFGMLDTSKLSGDEAQKHF